MNSYRDHYEKYLSIYEEMAVANGGKTVWIPTDAHDGWYVNSSVQDEDSEAWERGYPHKSRPSILPDDLSSDVERTAYTTISYAMDEAYETAYYRKDGDTIEWMDGFSERLPDYGDITAWAIFVDIDIDKDYKKRPLPEDHRDVVEQRLNLWVKGFSEMSGGMDHVKVLDSGGGMYVFIPPTCLSPVAEKYDREDLNIIFNHIGKRVRSVVGKLDDLICQQDNAPKELFSADKVQNKNRQFKTIGSIHKDLDSVVHPLLPQSIQVQHKSVDDITEKDVEKAKSWAESFTSDDHRESVSSVVEYLFQGDFTERDDMDLEYIEGNDWEEILDNWLADKKDSIRAWEQSQKQREDMSDDKLKTEITQDKEIAREAVNRINNQKLKSYIIDFLGSDMVYEKGGKDELDFFPFWRGGSTESGRSAFYDFYEGKARFTDKSDGTSRNIVYWVALEMTFDDENYPDTDIISSPSENLSPSDYRLCIEELRRRGEQIPILVPDVSEEDEQLSDWRIKEVGLQLGTASVKDVVENDDGSETLVPKAWNRTLERLDHENIEHNRDKKKPLKLSDITPYVDPELEQRLTKDEIYDRFFNSSGYYNPAFDSKKSYKQFLSNLPEFVIPFTYEGDINGTSPNGVVAGVFAGQTDESIRLSMYEPLPIESVNAIDKYTDLKIEVNENLDKEKMSILVK